MPVSGAQYDPAEMYHQTPAEAADRQHRSRRLGRAARTVRAFDCWPATPHAADADRAIHQLFKKLGKEAEAVEREASTAMQPAAFGRPERGRSAVKVVTAPGMEMTAIHELEKVTI